MQHFVQDTIWKTPRCPRLTLRSYKMPSVDWSRSFVRRWENSWKKTFIFACFWAFPFIFFTSLYLSGDFMWRWAYLKRPSVRRGIIFSWVRFVQLHCNKNVWFATFVCLTHKDTTTCGLRCERCCCRCWNESRLGSRFAYRVHQEVAFLGILCEAWPRRRGSHKFVKNICFAKATTVHPRCLNWWV